MDGGSIPPISTHEVVVTRCGGVAHRGMDPGQQVRALDQSRQSAEEFCVGLARQCAEKLTLQFDGLDLGGSHQLARIGGGDNRVGAAIIASRSTLDETAALQVVDETHHQIPVNSEPFRKLLLCLALIFDNFPQQREMSGLEAEGRDPVCPEARRVGAELREKEAAALADRGGLRVEHGSWYRP